MRPAPRVQLVFLVVILLVFVASSVNAKPVWRKHPWEDLIGGKNVKNNNGIVFKIFVIADPTKPCDQNAKNKLKVRYLVLQGNKAYQWLAARGLMVYRNNKWQKTNAFNDWAFLRKQKGLYWQACNRQTSSTGKPSDRCGQIIPDSARKGYLKDLKNLYQNNWKRKTVRGGDAYESLYVQLNSRNYIHCWYEANISIWLSRRNCFNSCVMRTPSVMNNKEWQEYHRCLKDCKARFQYIKCP